MSTPSMIPSKLDGRKTRCLFEGTFTHRFECGIISSTTEYGLKLFGQLSEHIKRLCHFHAIVDFACLSPIITLLFPPSKQNVWSCIRDIKNHIKYTIYQIT